MPGLQHVRRSLPGRVLLFLLAASFGLLGAVASDAQSPSPPRLADYGYGDLTSTARFASFQYFIPLPIASELAPGSRVEFIVSHSELLVPDLSSLTVLVNGVGVTSVRLDDGNRDRGLVTATLPALPDADALLIEVRVAVRLTRDTCEEFTNPAAWVTVHRESMLRLQFRPRTDGPLLSDLPRVFRTPASAPQGVAFELPAGASAGELHAAGLAAFEVGRWAGQENRDTAIFVPRPGERDARVATVALGTGGRVALDGTALASEGDRYVVRATRADAGDAAIATSPGSTRVAIAGRDDAALVRAAASLRDAVELPAPVAAVRAGAPRVPREAPWTSGAASLAQLGFQGQQVSWPGNHVMFINVERPHDWKLKGTARFELDIAVSSGVRAETSWARLVVNGLDIGTRRLDAASDGRYVFEVGGEVLDRRLDARSTRSLLLEVHLFLDVRTDACTGVSPGTAVATLLPTSGVFLPHDTYRGDDLSRYPAGVADEAGALIVVPDNPEVADVAAALNVAASLGRWSTGIDAPPRIVTASLVDSQLRHNRNVVLIGSPARNALAADAASRAARLFVEPSFDVQDASAGEGRGWLRIGRSPWDRNRHVLVIGGDGEAAVLAARALLLRSTVEAFRGPAAAIAGDTAGGTELPSPLLPQPRVLAPAVDDGAGWMPDTRQIVGAVVLAAFLAIVAAFVAIRVRTVRRRRV